MSLVFRAHAIQRMFERGITVGEVRAAISPGEVVEDYPQNFPYPSRLILGKAEGRSLHVVVAYNQADDQTIIITVYEPSADKWLPDSKTRKDP